MAAYCKILNRFRRSVLAQTYLTTLSHAREYHLLTIPIIPNPNSSTIINALPFPSYSHRPNLPSTSPYSFLGASGFFNSRAIFTRSEDDSEFGEDTAGYGIDSITDSPELVTESSVMDAALPMSGEESMLPIRVLTSMLDGFHELSGLPW